MAAIQCIRPPPPLLVVCLSDDTSFGVFLNVVGKVDVGGDVIQACVVHDNYCLTNNTEMDNKYIKNKKSHWIGVMDG
jgi:hypothetical protein